MPGQPWDDHQLVVVAGMHRSSTSTLDRVIGAAADASNLTGTGFPEDEGQFLQDVFPIGRAIGGMTRWALSDAAYLDETDAARVPDAAARLWSAWSPYWDTSRRVLVEKTPLNLTRTRFLQAAFPAAAFVVVTRHPVTQALAVGGKGDRAQRYGLGLPQLVHGWVRAHEAFAVDAPRLRRVHVVRYEDLVADPAAVVAGLAGFLDLDLPAGAAGTWDPARSRVYARRWEAAATSGRLSTLAAAVRAAPGGKAALRRPVQAVVDRAVFGRYAREVRDRFGSRIAALGYDVDDLDHARPWSTG